MINLKGMSGARLPYVEIFRLRMVKGLEWALNGIGNAAKKQTHYYQWRAKGHLCPVWEKDVTNMKMERIWLFGCTG